MPQVASGNVRDERSRWTLTSCPIRGVMPPGEKKRGVSSADCFVSNFFQNQLEILKVQLII